MLRNPGFKKIPRLLVKFNVKHWLLRHTTRVRSCAGSGKTYNKEPSGQTSSDSFGQRLFGIYCRRGSVDGNFLANQLYKGLQQDVLASYTLAVTEQQAVSKQAGPLSADKILYPKQRKHLSIYAKNRQQNIAFQAAYQSSQEDKGAQALRDPGEGLHKCIYSHSLQNPPHHAST
jgi:hypothetical protein